MSRYTNTSLRIVPSGQINVGRPFELVVRTHDLGGTDYDYVCSLTETMAYRVVDSSDDIKFLYGDPRLKRHD